MERRWAAGVTAIAATAAGCTLLVGSTDGYRPGDAGGCMSATDCADGGDVCCFSASASTVNLSIVGICQPTCGFAQLCRASAECGQAGPCSMQLCDEGPGVSFTLQACGTACGAAGLDSE